MANSKASLVDLSDLDPFHTPSRSNSPRIFTAPAASSSDAAAANAVAPRPPPPLPSKAVSKGQDPLDLFASLIDLNGDTEGSAGASTAGLRDVVRAQDERQEQVLSDLARDPFGVLPEEESVVGSSRAPAPHALPVRRPSRREASSSSATSFSPPRRLSGLMDSHMFTSSSPPHSIPITTTTSRPSLDPFHPSSPPLRSSDSFRKMRRASMDRLPTMVRTAEPSTSPDWGDFHSAVSPPPSKSHVSASTSHSALTSQSSTAASSRRPSPNPPTNGAPRPPAASSAARASTVPVTKREWQYDPRSPDAVQPIELRGVRPGVQRALDEDIAEGVSPYLRLLARSC